jgi:hypothetical protein
MTRWLRFRYPIVVVPDAKVAVVVAFVDVDRMRVDDAVRNNMADAVAVVVVVVLMK